MSCQRLPHAALLVLLALGSAAIAEEPKPAPDAPESLGWTDLRGGTFELVSVRTERPNEPKRRVIAAGVGDRAKVSVEGDIVRIAFVDGPAFELERDPRRETRGKGWIAFSRRGRGSTSLARILEVEGRTELLFGVIYRGSFTMKRVAENTTTDAE